MDHFISRGFFGFFKPFASLIAIIAIGAATDQAAFAQPLHFDVASVKTIEIPHGPVVHLGFRINYPLGTLGCDYCSVETLLEWAFSLHAYEIQGPGWLESATSQIEARMPRDSTQADVRKMMQSLLVDRFGLEYRDVDSDQPVLRLVSGKGGPKLRASISTVATLSYGDTYLHAQRMSMDGFALRLSKWLGVPVLNETGATAVYDINLTWARSAESQPMVGDLADVIGHQLGLAFKKSGSSEKIVGRFGLRQLGK